MKDVLTSAREVLDIEAQAILQIKERLDKGFEDAVRLILESPGKVVTTGIGKSGIVARKITATLASTGTTSVFLHPVEAQHGDLGMVSRGDVVLALSNSGGTAELVGLLPALKNAGAKIVSLTGGLNSELARASDAVVDCQVEREACPLGLAPTTSTTAALAVGDALAIVLMQSHRFKEEDFRARHPAGKLGEHLSLKVSEVALLDGERIPSVSADSPGSTALRIMDKGDIGTVLITKDNKLLGIFTDGDIRRCILQGVDLSKTPVSQVMSAGPMTVSPNDKAAHALQIMEHKLISALPIVDEDMQVLGIVHLHDLLGRGQVSFNGLANGSNSKG
jgi:arabinose-5-phosphate isomerase